MGCRCRRCDLYLGRVMEAVAAVSAVLSVTVLVVALVASAKSVALLSVLSVGCWSSGWCRSSSRWCWLSVCSLF